MKYINNKFGFSLVELFVAMAIFMVVASAGSMLFMAGEAAWGLVDVRSQIQENIRRSLQRISMELQESGDDQDGNMKVFIYDGTGENGTDILRFSIPICPCGVSPIDENTDVKYWGAPLNWGQSGCNQEYEVSHNNKVDVCHLPPGNPENNITLSVNENAVKSHLAHGDWLGNCNNCDPDNYDNQYVEYRLDADGRLVRRILNGSLTMISENIFAEYFSDFQCSFNADQTVVNIDVELKKSTNLRRGVTISTDLDIILRNKD